MVATSTNPYLFVSFKNNDSTIAEVNVRDNSVSRRELTSEQINSDGFHIELGFWGSKGQPIKTGIIKPMLYQDGDGTWEPFKHASVETSLTLAEGDAYENGQVTRARKQITLDGSNDEPYAYMGSPRNLVQLVKFITDINRNSSDSSVTGYKCNLLSEQTPNDLWNGSMDGFSVGNKSGAHDFGFRIDGVTTSVDSFRTWLQSHPLTIEYELETPATGQLKIPTVPSYFPYTEVSTDNTLETDMTWKVLADCDNSLAQEALEKRIEALEMNALGE